jgi:hypothetical protein
MNKRYIVRFGLPVAAISAALMAAGCGSSVSSGAAGSGTESGAAVSGKVQGAAIKTPTGFAESSASGVNYSTSTTGNAVEPVAVPVAYQNAKVCFDTNDNGTCDLSEDSVATDANGAFSLPAAKSGTLIAEVGSSAGYVDPNSGQLTHPAQTMTLRASADQIAAGNPVVISPLSTEALRTIQSQGLSYAEAVQAIAARLSLNNTPAQPTDVTVTPAQVIEDLATLSDARAQSALLFETQALANRYALAGKMLERGYVTAATVDPLSTVEAAQAAAFNLEGIPRYDHLFIVVFENHDNLLIDEPLNTNLFQFINVEGNYASNYFSTGDPSEPNYVAMSSGDDWGIVGDDAWNCLAEGDTADMATDVYVPLSPCTNVATHNIKGRRNLFTAMYQSGLATRQYSESMDPGQDPRVNGKGNSAISGVNKQFGNTEVMGGSLYMTKHQQAINYDEVRNRPDFFRNLARTMGGGEWDSGIESYAQAKGINWDTHQLEDDLVSGDVGALNYLVPDQCDDMHGVSGDAVNCDSDEDGILRGDAYAGYLVSTIEASPIWKNTARKVGIVIIFDEGSTYLGSTSCCGWNSGGAATSNGPIGESQNTPIANYGSGNVGDGPTIFVVLNNQPNAPKHIVDQNDYSHLSLVRTLQDMYGLADPGDADSYMNRSKYTQSYIAAHLAQLTEYKNSADPYFDAVRPMNHASVVPLGEQGTNDLPVVLPDLTQTSIWALQ